MYVRCRKRVYSEDRPRDAPLIQDDFETKILTSYQGSFDDEVSSTEVNMLYMVEAIRRFQERQLTKPTDALNAVAGITERISKRMNTSMLMGLPTKFLDLALLFVYNHTNRPPSGTNTRRDCFPSWTWAGVSGNSYWHWAYGTNLKPSFEVFLTSATWIRWFQWTNGRLGKVSAFHASDTARQEKLSTRFNMLSTVTWEPSVPPALPSSTLLVFYTVTVTLKAVDSTHNPHVLQLLDKGGKSCGNIILDVPETTFLWLKRQVFR